MIEKGYSSEQLAERIYDREMVKQLLCRQSYYLTNGEGARAVDELWVSTPEKQASAALGYNNGWYTGIAEVRRHLVEDYEARTAGKHGVAAMDTITTPLVYLADDGRTARYLGYRIGFTAEGRTDGTAAVYNDFGLVHADLVKEGEDWKLWHLVLQHDHTVEAGTDYSQVPVKLPFGEDPLEKRFGEPTRPQTVYEPFFGWEHMWEDMPRPYESYTDKNGCGPESDLNKPYYLRERR